jgi:hypothetical protein
MACEHLHMWKNFQTYGWLFVSSGILYGLESYCDYIFKEHEIYIQCMEHGLTEVYNFCWDFGISFLDSALEIDALV